MDNKDHGEQNERKKKVEHIRTEEVKIIYRKLNNQFRREPE